MRLKSPWVGLTDLFCRPEDERIYALVRVAFAAVALLNLISLWPDRHVFFSEAGFIDQRVAIADAHPVYPSIFRLSDSETAVTTVMTVTAVALVMLMAGIGARAAAFWVFVWHISYVTRAPIAGTGWDSVLRSFSFLLLVSPLGKCWTLPALWRGGSAWLAMEVPRYGLTLMRLQVVVIYWQTVLARFLHPAPYWKNGEFLSYFLLSHHARWPGTWLLEQGDILTLGTYAIQLTEVAIPVLLWVKKTRWWGMLLGVLLHAGVTVVTKDIVLFALAMTMTYLAFLRKEDIERMERWTSRRSKRGAQSSA